MNVLAARIRAALETDNNARFYAHVVIWALLGIVLVGRGLHGLLPHATGYEAEVRRYYAVTFVPGAKTVWHAAAQNYDRLWSWLWGLWFLFTFALPIHFGIAFSDELRRGWQRARLRHESGETQQAAAGASTPVDGTIPQRQGGGLRERTIFELLSLEMIAEFASETLFRLWNRIRGGSRSVG